MDTAQSSTSLDDSQSSIEYHKAQVKQYILNGMEDTSIDHHSPSDEGVEFVLNRSAEQHLIRRLEQRISENKFYLPTGTILNRARLPFHRITGVGTSRQGITERLSIYVPYTPMRTRTSWWKDMLIGLFWLCAFVVILALLYSIVVPPAALGGSGGGGGGSKFYEHRGGGDLDVTGDDLYA
jgi:hypothetical protein